VKSSGESKMVYRVGLVGGEIGSAPALEADASKHCKLSGPSLTAAQHI